MEALQRLHNQGSISTGFDIDNSLKFEPDNSEFIYRSPSQTGSDQKRMAFSIWLKRTELGTAQTFMLFGNGGSNSTRLDIGFDTSDRLQIRNVNSNWRLTTQVFRDTSAWYHLFFQFNTLDTTADDRIKVWVNGNLIAIADYTTVNDPGYDATLGFNRNYKNVLGARQELDSTSNQYFAGYIAQVYGSGGTPPAVTDFGEFDEDTGIWKPIDISDISPPEPINGFFLDFSDASDLGNDASGNNNNWTLNNITSADQATDTPTNNFCTINTIEYTGGYNITNGGTQAERNGNTAWYSTTSSMGVSKGKWYWEAQFASGATSFMAGVSIDSYISTQANPFDGQYLGSGSGDGGFGYNNAGNVYYNNTVTSGYGSAPSTNIIGLAIDMDNEKAYVSINGTWQNSGDPTSGATGTGAIDLFLDSNGDTAFFSLCAYNPNYTHKINFGGYTTMSISSAASDDNGYGNFEYAPPSGYYALCTKNLEEFG